MRFEIDDDERAEVHAALEARQSKLTQRVKQLTEDDMPADALRRILALYAPNERGPGLVRVFLSQTDLDEEVARDRAKKGEKRDAAGQADMFGGGAETGGGHPAGEIVSLAKPAADPANGFSADEMADADGAATDPRWWVRLGVAGTPSDMDAGAVAEWKDAGPFAAVRHEGTEGCTLAQGGVELTGAAPEVVAGEVPTTFADPQDAERAAAWLNLRHDHAAHALPPLDAATGLVLVDPPLPALPDDVTDLGADDVARFLPRGPFGVVHFEADDVGDEGFMVGRIDAEGNLLALEDDDPDCAEHGTEYAVRDSVDRRAAWLNLREAHRTAAAVVADYEIVDDAAPSDGRTVETVDGETTMTVRTTIPNVLSAAESAPSPDDAWDQGPSAHRAVPAAAAAPAAAGDAPMFGAPAPDPLRPTA